MFEAFQRNFPRDLERIAERHGSANIPSTPGLREFFSAFGGASFLGGLYRVIRPEDLAEWEERICLAFPQFIGRITCFGYDWLGSTFALDSKRFVDGQPGVVMFEPGTGEALEIPSNLQTFHDVGLMEFGEAALAISFKKKWEEFGGKNPSYSECVGYKKPLFLGGVDEVENLDVSDLDVYWHFMGQLILKARGLPQGTPIRVNVGDA